VLRGLEAVQGANRVDPLCTELRLLADRRDVLDRVECPVTLLRVGDVRIEERQIELHVQRLFVELPREVHARFGRVDVLVEV
jgi:hypothetical protein